MLSVMGGAAKLGENPVPEIEEVCYDDPVESRFSPEQIWNPGLELILFVCKDVFFWRMFDPNAIMIMMIQWNQWNPEKVAKQPVV